MRRALFLPALLFVFFLAVAIAAVCVHASRAEVRPKFGGPIHGTSVEPKHAAAASSKKAFAPKLETIRENKESKFSNPKPAKPAKNYGKRNPEAEMALAKILLAPGLGKSSKAGSAKSRR
ncbi:hypothetical protein DFJ73DRAFT_759405 [Zopfochytrium polystomum]|nr:hypothetical protein DFJ73DRAFT_759405 [Zopfochytrium polystomum]